MQVYAIGIPGSILLCLGIPASTLIIMLSIRKRLKEPRTTATFGFLYHQFKCALQLFTKKPASPKQWHLASGRSETALKQSLKLHLPCCCCVEWVYHVV